LTTFLGSSVLTDAAVYWAPEVVADPAVDAESDLATWPTTLARVLEAGGPDAVFVPGHGAVLDSAFIRRQQDWLRGITTIPPHFVCDESQTVNVSCVIANDVRVGPIYRL
jgi:glyoxylase-like metal-dependent hydrolase (beta-lactamase superfamily II)